MGSNPRLAPWLFVEHPHLADVATVAPQSHSRCGRAVAPRFVDGSLSEVAKAELRATDVVLFAV